MTRSVPEWIGKTPDSKPPAHVKARIFAAHDGICHISKRKIRSGEPWDLEHVLAICLGGQNRERNMAPALVEPHKEKTRKDVSMKTKADRIRAKHLGLHKPASKWGNRRFKQKIGGTVVDRDTGEPVRL